MRGVATRPGRGSWPQGAVEPDEVWLPVCPRCGNIGKNPGGSQTTFACVGPAEQQHKRTRMIEVLFKPDSRELLAMKLAARENGVGID